LNGGYNEEELETIQIEEISRLARGIWYAGLFVVVVSAIFWVWAVYNTITQSLDSGVLLFLVTAAAGITGIVASKKKGLCVSKAYFWLTVIGHAISTIIYAGATILRHETLWVVYCVVAAFCWLATGIYFGRRGYMFQKRIEQFAEAHGQPDNALLSPKMHDQDFAVDVL